MTNLTLAVDEDILRRVRIRALALDTSVYALVREYLRQLAGPSTAAEWITECFAATRALEQDWVSMAGAGREASCMKSGQAAVTS